MTIELGKVGGGWEKKKEGRKKKGKGKGKKEKQTLGFSPVFLDGAEYIFYYIIFFLRELLKET